MMRLAKSGVSKAALFGILFFVVGCGSKEEENPPNYVVKEVQTGTTAENAQGVTGLPEDKNTAQESVGNSSIVREEVADSAAKKNGFNREDADGKEPQENDVTDERDAGQGDIGIRDATSEPEIGENGDGVQAYPSAESQESGIPPENVLKGEQANVMSVDELSLLPSGTIVDAGIFSDEELAACFYFEEIPDAVFERMKGNSYGEDCTVAVSQLRYVRVLHYGFDRAAHIGELVVNCAVAQDIRDIFKELFDAQYPIEKMVLIDTYGGDDNASMADNNTSSFNFRVVEGTTSLSKHAYGLAIDVNPLYNPYIPLRDGLPVVLPENGEAYADRSAACEYYIRHGDICYEAFVSRGFTWGGDWTTGKDYQHFSKVVD